MRWRIGNYTFDRRTRRVIGSPGKLNKRQGRLLEFLIVKYDQPYNDEQLKKAVWEGEDAEGSIHKYISVLRDALGGKGESLDERKLIIDTDPYRLMIKPEPIEDDEFAYEPEISFGESGASAFGESTESSHAEKVTFTHRETSLASELPGTKGFDTSKPKDLPLVVDGIIFSLAAELIHSDDPQAKFLPTGAVSYERALEDLAFAITYAGHIVTSKTFRPSPSGPSLAHTLVKSLEEICEPREYPADIGGGRLLTRPDYREQIREDIRRFAKCSTEARNKYQFRAYIQREAALYLGDDERLYQDGLRPEEYIYGDVRPFYKHRELQDELGSATDHFVTFLRQAPDFDARLATDPLREFVTRNVLTHITLLWEASVYTKPPLTYHMPYFLRTLVIRRRLKDLRNIQSQKVLHQFIMEDALTIALGRTRINRRYELIGHLLALRKESPFKEIRDYLNEHELLLVEPSARKEREARKLHRAISALAKGERNNRVQLANGFVLRRSSIAPTRIYEREFYSLFPELKSIR